MTAYLFRKALLLSLLFIFGISLATPTPTTAQRTAQVKVQETARAAASQGGRMRPPTIVTCDRNKLTVYSGQVIGYSRRAGLTTLGIKTDWDTNEQVTLRYPGKSDPSKWFLLRGKPFTKNDWTKIESSKNHLLPDMRVSAWVCSDGSRPIIDWQPSTGNTKTHRATP